MRYEALGSGEHKRKKNKQWLYNVSTKLIGGRGI